MSLADDVAALAIFIAKGRYVGAAATCDCTACGAWRALPADRRTLLVNAARLALTPADRDPPPMFRSRS